MERRDKGLFFQKRVLILLGLICGWLAAGAVAFADDGEAEEGASAKLPVFLYFADPVQPYLKAEQRPAMEGEDPVEFCRLLVESLIRGPNRGLARTIPAQSKLRAVFIEGKTAYVDFSREISDSHPGGIATELMTVYSIVNTLVLNLDGVDQVKLLIEGRDADTLAGHIDIRFPLSADMMIIR
jgi:spore germination protein GerM